MPAPFVPKLYRPSEGIHKGHHPLFLTSALPDAYGRKYNQTFAIGRKGGTWQTKECSAKRSSTQTGFSQ